MNLSEREELRLVLLRDASVGHFMWLDRWQVSYPQVIAAECSAHEALTFKISAYRPLLSPNKTFLCSLSRMVRLVPRLVRWFFTPMCCCTSALRG